MSSFDVLMISAILATTSAYPFRSPYPEYIHPPTPYTNYQVLVNRPYPANHFSIEQPEAGNFISYDDLTPFEQLPPVPPRSKTQTLGQEEVRDVVEDVLKLLVDQRLCEIGNNAPIAKRSVNTARATETSPFTPQQLAFLKDLKPEDIKQLIKLLIPAAPVANRTLQEEFPTFYMPTPVWHSLPALPPSPYESHLLPFQHLEPQFISYEPRPAEEVRFHIINPYAESVAPPIMLNKLPLSSPFVYSVQISAPLSSNQMATRPLTVVPNQMVFKPPTHPATKVEAVTSQPLEKLQSIFSQSRILLDKDMPTKQPSSTEKIQDLAPNKAEDASNATEKVDSANGEAVKRTAKSAKASEPGENEQLLEVFKAIREDLMKNNACRVATLKRHAVNERPDGDTIRKQMYQNYLSRHAIPPVALPKRHQPARVLYHKYTHHTPPHSANW